MSSTIEVHMISSRPLLDEFINMWNGVNVSQGETTIKVLTTGYDEKRFVLNNGIKIEYIKQKTFPKTSYMNQAWARNELLCHSESEYILFFDDWQRPHPDILVRHLVNLKKGYMVCGRRIECDKDGNNCKGDSRPFNSARECHATLFWTCNASVSRENALKVNGFDNRFCGGSAGEDYDFGARVGRTGIKSIYDPDAISYHHSHDHLGSWSQNKYVCDISHDLSKYKHIPEYKHFGDWNLMVSDELELWWEGPIKYYKCKKCGLTGILDSMQVYYYNRDNGITRVENGLEQVRECLKKV